MSESNPLTELTFEQALQRLETIVQGMEQGRLPLEQSLARYEEGMQLASFCAATLGNAEKKIELLQKQREGKPQWQPWSETP